MKKLLLTLLATTAINAANGQITETDDLYGRAIPLIEQPAPELQLTQFKQQTRQGGGFIAVGGTLLLGNMIYNVAAADKPGFSKEAYQVINMVGFLSITIGGLTIAGAGKARR